MLQLGGMTGAAHNQPDVGPIGVGGYALLTLSVLALPLRHRYPLGVVAFTFGITQLYWAQDVPRGPAFVAFVVAVMHLLLLGRRRIAIATLAVSFALFPTTGYLLGHEERPNVLELLGAVAWLLAFVAVVEVVRERRDRAREAARSEAEAMRRQVADERVRMARDLHDSVAHNMSLISIQAGVALHLLEQRDSDSAAGPPPAVAQSLSVIKDASKEALVELRSILGVLRHVDVDTNGDEGGTAEPDAVGTEAGPRMPVPSLDRLGDLVDRARSMGVDVQVETNSRTELLDHLPRAVDLAAFRIVQESLTNVSRHSGSDSAVVRLTESGGTLRVEVLDEGPIPGTDHGPLPDVPGGGNGIVGMRERAAAVGGYLQAGPRPGRGFAVRADLPLGDDVAVGGTDDRGREATTQGEGT
jgi:signal transduction histidine kinase